MGIKIFALLVAFANIACAQPKPLYLVLISIDGLKPAYLLDHEKLGIKIPNLASLMQAGSYAQAAESVFPSVTFPAHTAIVTGVQPAKHGIIQNKVFDPLEKNQEGWFWYAEAIKVKTLWQAAKEKGATTASVNWSATAGADIDYNIPEYWRARTPEDFHLLRALATPRGFLQDIEKIYGALNPQDYPDQKPEGISDVMVANALKYLIANKKPNLILAHFVDLDTVEHKRGPNSTEAFQTLEKTDALIGQIIEATEQAGTFDQTVFTIVSDHGFTNYSKRIRLNPVFRDNGLLITDDKGKITDWKAAIHYDGPLVGIMLKDPNDKETLNKVHKILEGLIKDPKNGIARIYERREMAKYGGFPDAAFVIEASPGYSFNPAMEEPLVSDTSSKGAHGYCPSNPDMNAAFVISGNGIRKGVVIKKMKLIDVAPTLGKLMGWNLPQAEGKILDLIFF